MPKPMPKLSGFWSQDIWPVTEIPVPQNDPNQHHYQRHLRFASPKEGINTELKYALKQLFTNGQWAARDQSIADFLTKFVQYLNENEPNTLSLLQHSLSYWEEQFRAFLAKKGYQTHKKVDEFTKAGVKRTSFKSTYFVCKLRRVYRIVADYHDTRDEWDKDVINVHRLGLDIPASTSIRTLNLSDLRPDWLREASRQYLRYHASHKAFATLVKDLGGLKRFSRFLAQHYPSLEPSELSRQIIIDFVGYLQVRLKKETIAITLSTLNMFLTTCATHGFAELPKRPLIYKEDFPKRPRSRPKFLPDEVHRQIVAQVARLPAPYSTMLAILEQTGARVSEVLGLQIDCLSRDPAGDYFLKRWLSKQKKSHSVPILPALAARIQAVAQTARQTHGPAVKYLFGNKNDRPLSYKAFDRVLTKWAIECDIRDNSGKLYIPHFHQFRHTVGTRMLNNGVSQYLVQRYLGHDSPDMTAVYAHLTDDTAKRAVADFLAQSDKQLKRLSEK
jgi:integrase/recombinase XerD